jgi:hypothetical protein
MGMDEQVDYERVLYDLHFEYRQNARTEEYYYALMSKNQCYSARYHKWIKLEAGMRSDGASGPAPDLASLGWWIHDKLCTDRKFADGTPCSAWQASMILHDILKDEGRPVRASTWCIATFLWQKARGHK